MLKKYLKATFIVICLYLTSLLYIFFINPLQYREVKIPDGTIIEVQAIATKGNVHKHIKFSINNTVYIEKCNRMFTEQFCEEIPSYKINPFTKQSKTNQLILSHAKFYDLFYKYSAHSSQKGVFVQTTLTSHENKILNYAPSSDEIENLIQWNQSDRFMVYTLFFYIIMIVVFLIIYLKNIKK